MRVNAADRFGAGISVGGAAEGALGPVTVTSATTATAQLVIDPSATPGVQTVSQQLESSRNPLINGFTVTDSKAVISLGEKSGPNERPPEGGRACTANVQVYHP